MSARAAAAIKAADLPPGRARAATRFVLPADREATAPPPTRDGVRLLEARAGAPIRHRRFRDLAAALAPGDLVVVNTSTTAPAAVDARRATGERVVVHVSGPDPAEAGSMVVELRAAVDGGRVRDGRAGETLTVPGGIVRLGPGGPRLHRARFDVGAPLLRWLDRHGRPITYSYLRGRPPIAEYRTVFARPGGPDEFPSAEMPSAGRPFTREVLARLAGRGVGVAEVVLHTGVSSPEAGELPQPERFRVPAVAAAAVNATRAAGGRIVAVGTTVTRALESVAAAGGTVRVGEGWTALALGPRRPARVVDGLVTGWHEPQASHLLLLEAVAGPELVGRAYEAALAGGYRWHEFGDSCLLLP